MKIKSKREQMLQKNIIGKIKNKKMKKQDNVTIGIYKITSPTNKIYIGQSINIENRFDGYKKLNCKNQTKLYNSLKKYGWENHIFEIIEECSEDQLLERETYWKLFYKVLEIPSLCCRIDGKGGRDSDETKKKKSIAHIGNKYNLGKNHTVETKDKIRDKVKGMKRTPEQIKNMSKPRTNTEKFKYSNIGKKEKCVLQFTKNNEFVREWNSVKEAEEFFGSKNYTNISAAALGKQKTAWGFIWKYKEI